MPVCYVCVYVSTDDLCLRVCVRACVYVEYVEINVVGRKTGSAAIPGFTVGGGTMVTENYIRLTPNINGRSGACITA